MLFATIVPGTAKLPPTTNTGCVGPGSSVSHSVVALTAPSVPGTPEPGSHCVEHWAETRVTGAPTTNRSPAEHRSEGRGIMEHLLD